MTEVVLLTCYLRGCKQVSGGNSCINLRFTAYTNLWIPETEGENSKQKVIDLAQIMGVNITQNYINACHRLGARHQTRVRAIIVPFFARDKRNQMLINKNKLKDIIDYKNVFISEDITQLWANLLLYVKPEEHVCIYPRWEDYLSNYR